MSNSEAVGGVGKDKAEGEDQRRQQRHSIQCDAKVENLQTGEELGRLVNLNSGGLMLMGAGTGAGSIEEDCIYQLRIVLPEPIDGQSHFGLGADCLWVRSEPSENLKWAGFRIIDISNEALRLLEVLVEQSMA